MLQLRWETGRGWLAVVRADLDTFLADHANNERKASAQAMSLVAHYPDREALVESMIELAIEELDHFKRVVGLMRTRGVPLAPDAKDPYVNTLLQRCRGAGDDRLMDRLILFGLVEARGCERFRCLAEGLDDPGLRDFYAELARADARHHALFVGLAREYFDDAAVDERLDQMLDWEAEAIAAQPVRAAMH